MSSFSLSELEIFTLFKLRDGYSTLPSCQREYVWNLRQQQLFIDTLLKELPVPPIAYIETYIPLLGNKKELVDGQQRFTTICRFFRDEFRTAKNFSMEEGNPTQPGKYYSELPIDIRTKFDSYKLPMISISNGDDRTIGTIFRRWQGGEKLKLAEKIYSYDGVTKDIAIRIVGHKFWSVIYRGETKRRQPFQAVIKAMILEKRGVFSNLTNPNLIDMLTASADWTDTPNRMERRMNFICKLFDGADIVAINQFTLAYQTIMLLEDSGYVLTSCKDGCLTKWFMKIKGMAIDMNQNYRKDLFVQLDKVVQQRKFWNEQWEIVLLEAKDGERDPKRLANSSDKIKLWNIQEGTCKVCGKEMRWTDSVLVGHHVLRHENNGKTELENMALIHQKCHKFAESGTTPLALDGANAPDFQHEFPAEVLVGDGVLPEPPRQ